MSRGQTLQPCSSLLQHDQRKNYKRMNENMQTCPFLSGNLLTIRDNSFNWRVLLWGDVSDDCEGKYSHQKAGEGVDEGHGQGVVKDVVVELVVAGKRDHGTKRYSHWVEGLRHCVHPYLEWVVYNVILSNPKCARAQN